MSSVGWGIGLGCFARDPLVTGTFTEAICPILQKLFRKPARLRAGRMARVSIDDERAEKFHVRIQTDPGAQVKTRLSVSTFGGPRAAEKPDHPAIFPVSGLAGAFSPGRYRIMARHVTDLGLGAPSGLRDACGRPPRLELAGAELAEATAIVEKAIATAPAV
jgi:hypothetical protein